MKKKLLAAFGIAVLTLVAGFAVLRLFFFDVATLDGDDMQPTLGPGATVIVRRRAAVERGDLILFERDGRYQVRRVVALPGERIAMAGYTPVVRGQPPATYEDLDRVAPAGRPARVRRETFAGRRCEILDIEKRTLADAAEQAIDGYFVLADNRESGSDSRNFGAVPPGAVRGVVVHVWDRGARLDKAP